VLSAIGHRRRRRQSVIPARTRVGRGQGRRELVDGVAPSAELAADIIAYAGRLSGFKLPAFG
jgi:hypothetical protein